ncbi:MAG: RNA-directed DNA polymerase [Roseicyclus sp.]|uniref:RNA-directed DNA polymerase n=1 Tax=Roseicyclus sp. TaxID=1914329 RepID=UPI003A887435
MPVRLGEGFGLEPEKVNGSDWALSVARISTDSNSDFIFAPHLRLIYRYAAGELIESLKSKLRAGDYVLGTPMTIEVPKASRISVRSNPPRPGPNYTRPGSILFPEDRLFYQFCADYALTVVEGKTDRARSFSHQIDYENPESLFKSTRACWADFQRAIKEYSDPDEIKYVMKIDIANFFGSINQHVLVNNLLDHGLSRDVVERLEVTLTSFTNSRSSRGIIQGIFPSDLIGNFYLEPFDRFMSDIGIQSARYVDDIYIFFESVNQAEETLKKIIPKLRELDLSLNEAKSKILPKNVLTAEEPDLQELFDLAIAEIREQLDENDFSTAYGFQEEWDWEDEGDDDDAKIHLEATKSLFDSVNLYSGYEEEVERFCIPLFIKAKSDYAIEHVISSFDKRPSMAQIYCSYLGKFTDRDEVLAFLRSKVEDARLHDWQLMWVIGAFLQGRHHVDADIVPVLRVFNDRDRHDAVRAIAAIFVGLHGDAIRRRSLFDNCADCTIYVQAAIFYISLRKSDATSNNHRTQWVNRSTFNTLISKAWSNMKAKRPA